MSSPFKLDIENRFPRNIWMFIRTYSSTEMFNGTKSKLYQHKSDLKHDGTVLIVVKLKTNKDEKK